MIKAHFATELQLFRVTTSSILFLIVWLRLFLLIQINIRLMYVHTNHMTVKKAIFSRQRDGISKRP